MFSLAFCILMAVNQDCNQNVFLESTNSNSNDDVDDGR